MEEHNHEEKKEEHKEAHTHEHNVHHEDQHKETHHVHTKPKESFSELLSKRNDLKNILGGVVLFIVGVILMLIFPRVANPQTGGMLVSLGIPAMLIGVGFFGYGIILSIISLFNKNKAN